MFNEVVINVNLTQTRTVWIEKRNHALIIKKVMKISWMISYHTIEIMVWIIWLKLLLNSHGIEKYVPHILLTI